MCYNTKLIRKASEIEIRFNAIFEDIDLYQPSNQINAFEFPKTPIITNLQQKKIEHCSWGLIPQWAEHENIRKYTLNARIETITKKASFKENINNRCLIIADGFYEWQWLDTKGRNKQKYEVGLPNNDIFAFAGLWSEWYDEISKETKKTYTIITKEAQGIMREIHNSKKRMPLILSKDHEKHWLLNNSIEEFKNINVKLNANKILSNNSNNSQLSIF